MNPRILIWIILVITIVAVFINLPGRDLTIKVPGTGFEIRSADLPGKFPLKLGLDLQGGTQLVLSADLNRIAGDQRDNALESARSVIERRVNLYGVSESVVQTSRLGNDRRIIVELPGVKDASAAAALVGRTAQLDFRELVATQSSDLEATSAAVAADRPTGLTGADLKSAAVGYSSQTGDPEVQITFNGEGARKFAEITKRNVGKPVAIFLDDELVTAPIVQQEIIGGVAVINGNFSLDDAKRLSIQLNAGALPVPIKLLSQQQISASLGDESVRKSMVAGVVGLLTVMLFMVVYYGWYGVLADLALLIYTAVSLAVFRTGFFVLPPVTLTLAGIAGFILSIGMAVDANILIFERMKEEKRWGRSGVRALEHGFQRAWASIRDSNISSLITAVVLYSFGTGPVKGFAVTLAIGVLVSMFTALTVTKTFLKLIVKS